LTTSAGTIFKDQQGSPWQGNFAPGDHLIGMGELTPSIPIDITFAHPVSGIGTQLGYDIISTAPFSFTEALNLYDADTTCSRLLLYPASWIMPPTIPRCLSSNGHYRRDRLCRILHADHRWTLPGRFHDQPAKGLSGNKRINF
jgi:hypothetical protein